MSDDMSLEDSAKVLTRYGHHGMEWASNMVQVVAIGTYRTLSPLEARAIAREYLRLDGKLPAVGPATKDVLSRVEREVQSLGHTLKRGEATVVIIRVENPIGFLAELEAKP